MASVKGFTLPTMGHQCPATISVLRMALYRISSRKPTYYDSGWRNNFVCIADNLLTAPQNSPEEALQLLNDFIFNIQDKEIEAMPKGPKTQAAVLRAELTERPQISSKLDNERGASLWKEVEEAGNIREEAAIAAAKVEAQEGLTATTDIRERKAKIYEARKKQRAGREKIKVKIEKDA